MSEPDHPLDAERGMDSREVLAHRLRLAQAHLAWSPARTAAFTRGFAEESAGQADQARAHRHDGELHGYDERTLTPDLVESLGYRDGLSAARSRKEEIDDFGGDPLLMLEHAALWAENGNGDFDIEEATWSASTADDLSVFLGIMTRRQWIGWFLAEHRSAIEAGRPGYGNLLTQDIHTPVVYVAYPDGRADVWDGWHRIGAAMLKGSGGVPALRGVPAPAPSAFP